MDQSIITMNEKERDSELDAKASDPIHVNNLFIKADNLERLTIKVEDEDEETK